MRADLDTLLSVQHADDHSCLAQDLLNDPNPKSPAQAEAFMLFTNQKAEYKRRVKEQAKRNPVPS